MNLKELTQEKFSENRLNKKNMSTVTTWPWLLTTRLLLTFVRSCTCLRREFFGFLNWNYLAVMRPCDEFSAHCQSWFRAVLGIFLAMTIFFLSQAQRLSEGSRWPKPNKSFTKYAFRIWNLRLCNNTCLCKFGRT